MPKRHKSNQLPPPTRPPPLRSTTWRSMMNGQATLVLAEAERGDAGRASPRDCQLGTDSARGFCSSLSLFVCFEGSCGREVTERGSEGLQRGWEEEAEGDMRSARGWDKAKG